MEESRKTFSVIGIGRLGLCAALCMAKNGYDVIGVDINKQYVDQLNNKTFISREPNVNEYLQMVSNFRATTDITDALSNSDYIYIIVDTPTTEKYNYDTKNLDKVLSSINSHQIKNKHIIIACTVMPGYINNHAHNLLKNCENVSISYNPEFIRQSSIINDYQNPDMVLIGEGSQKVGDYLEEFYRNMCKNKPLINRMSPASAEICKLALNCFITTKIAYANMIGDIADNTMGANKYDILNAVGTDSRVGQKCLQPGYGFGGPCFPRDNRAFGHYAESVGVPSLLSKATDELNNFHTKKQAQDLINENREIYTITDVTYKPNCSVPIIEESQKLKMAAIIAEAGKKVIIQDRDFIIKCVEDQYGNLFEYEIV